VNGWIRRWQRNMAVGRRQRVAADVGRAAGWMTVLVMEARQAGAEIPIEITRAVTAWRVWAEILTAWAEETGR
jgi:hypothetical protein